MNRRVFIIHGWGADSKANWFPWVKEELEKLGFDVIAPDMPNTENPKQNEWVAEMHEVIGDIDENTFVIGHSLGTMAILRFLESLPEEKQIGGAILVSGFCQSLGLAELENFHTTPLDFERIKKACKHFVVFHNDDDLVVPLEKGIELRNKVDADIIILSGFGHLNMGTGYYSFPEVIDEINKISK